MENKSILLKTQENKVVSGKKHVPGIFFAFFKKRYRNQDGGILTLLLNFDA